MVKKYGGLINFMCITNVTYVKEEIDILISGVKHILFVYFHLRR